MNSVICTSNFKPFALILSLHTHFKTCIEHIHEFFTHQRSTIQKIETLNKRILAIDAQLHSTATFTAALFELKDILIQEAHLHNHHFFNQKIRKAYERFCNNLNRAHEYALSHCIEPWLNRDHNRQDKEKLVIARWLQASPAQRHFAAHYHIPEVPLKFSEIPAGSVLITYPFAFIRHMQLEKKISIFQTIYLLIKALYARICTGKQFTHVSLSMGHGTIFDLDKGRGQIKNLGDKVFYGIVLAPNKQKMLIAYHRCFPHTERIGFTELTAKINAEITKATEQKKLRHDIISIIQTSIREKRPRDYRCTEAWKSGACHFSCSATTSALFSFFGIDIGKQFNKIDKNIIE